MNRRAVIAGTGTTALVALAGCLFADEEHDYDRGEITVVVDGEPVDLSADRFQAEHAENESIAFHLHEGDEHWYMEGEEPVTFAEGIDLLPHFAYERRDGAHVVTIDYTEYDGSEQGTELTFLVDGDPVDPTEYEVSDGDELRLEITTEATESEQ